MSPERRRPVRRSDGSLWSEDTFSAYLRDLDARAPKRATVERLSKRDAEIVAFEATARGARAA